MPGPPGLSFIFGLFIDFRIDSEPRRAAEEYLLLNAVKYNGKIKRPRPPSSKIPFQGPETDELASRSVWWLLLILGTLQLSNYNLTHNFFFGETCLKLDEFLQFFFNIYLHWDVAFAIFSADNECMPCPGGIESPSSWKRGNKFWAHKHDNSRRKMRDLNLTKTH